MTMNRYRRIKGGILRPQLSRAGFIKVGGKSTGAPRWGARGPWLPPVRYINPPRFEVTTMEQVAEEMRRPNSRDDKTYRIMRGYRRNEPLHSVIGEQPNRLSVRLVFESPEDNLTTHLGYHDGRRWVCTGDGTEATEIGSSGQKVRRTCPCARLRIKETEHLDPEAGECKPRGVLTVWLEDSRQWPLVHLFKTTSWESISKLQTQLDLLYQQFGTLAWLPLVLRVDASHKRFSDGKGGHRRTIQPAVTIAVKGSPQDAVKAALEWKQSQEQARIVCNPEQHRKLLVADMQEEARAEGEEFFPDAAKQNLPMSASARLTQLTKE